MWELAYIINKLPVNPLNTELNPICHLPALLGAHHILHVSSIRVNGEKSPVVHLVQQRCAEGLNSGVKGLTAVGLTPGGSSAAHIYTPKILNTENEI
jgi:hypothetical protein